MASTKKEDEVQKTEARSLKLEVLEKMSTLSAAGFGLVAALAWNSAIQDLFAQIFPNKESLSAKFAYAIILTILVVLITTQLGRATQKFKLLLHKDNS